MRILKKYCGKSRPIILPIRNKLSIEDPVAQGDVIPPVDSLDRHANRRGPEECFDKDYAHDV